MAAGIIYLPADQVFYKSFPYKIELSPKFKGLGGVSGKKGCQIDIGNPIKARRELAAFNEHMEKILSNVEYRQEIREFVERLPKVQYKTRMGGENNLFYFRDPDIVMLVVNRYRDVINSVTGPINDEHEDVMDEINVIMRDNLYFNKFRYYIEFPSSEGFVDGTAQRIVEYLGTIEKSSWRDYKLRSLIEFYDINGYVTASTPNRHPALSRGYVYNHSFPVSHVALYLTDPNDYIYLKLMAGEFVSKNHEVMLFNELS